MRLSCNGCRVLRKGCSEDCPIRPCLEWIKTSEAQAHATVFLAKFYGRAGLLNLINAGPGHLRPAIFRSLLYEACGRIVNPVYGSVGLLWTGSWNLCQAAVEAVLRGEPIAQIPSGASAAASIPIPPLKSYDIRHISKEHGAVRSSAELHKVAQGRTRFKRSRAISKVEPNTMDFERTPSDGSLSHAEEEQSDGSHVSQAEPDENSDGRAEGEEMGLELTLGFEPVSNAIGCRSADAASPALRARHETGGLVSNTCHLDLELELAL